MSSATGGVTVSGGAGITTFGGGISLEAIGARLALNVNGSINSDGGNVTLQATGNVTVAAIQTVNSDTGSLTLAQTDIRRCGRQRNRDPDDQRLRRCVWGQHRRAAPP